MHIITRRRFMKRSLLGAIGMAMGSTLNVPGFLRRAMADNQNITWNGNKLLFVFLRGGNDALNMIVPTGDDAYSPAIRPTLHIPGPLSLATDGQCHPGAPGEALDLGNGFASAHPNLVDMCPVYNAGELAVCHRVGYPDQSRSHFDSQRYWEIGIPQEDAERDGIFYRTIVETGLHETQMLPAVSFNSTMPLLIKGDVPFANINDPGRFNLLGVYAQARQKHIDHIARMHGLPYAAKKNRDILYPTGERFVNSIEQIQSIAFEDNGLDELGNKIIGSPFLDDDPAMTHLFPMTTPSDDKMFNSGTARAFFRSLKYSAQVLAETDAVIAGTELDGFDTHNSQAGGGGILTGGHADRMAWIGWAIYALKKYLSHPDVNIWDNTIVVTMSEFGRTTIENGSNGTDHAEAGVMFVAGGPIQGGVYQCNGGAPPSLPGADPANPWAVGENTSMLKVNGRYLERTTDYRSVLGEIIRDHLGATQAHLDTIIPGYSNPGENLLTGGVGLDGTPIVGELGLLT